MPIHVVKQGDTLSRIAAEHRISLQELINVNQLSDPNRLVIGQAIAIPTPRKIYVVRPGDTLWAIANRYGITIQEILRENPIPDPNSLNVGQILTIPIPEAIHVVRPGETLWVIAERYNTTVEAISEANNLTNPSLIYPGQRLTIVNPKIEVNGYLTKLSSTGEAIVQEVGDFLTYLSLFSYRILPDGNYTSLNDSSLIIAAHGKGTSPLLTLTNFSGRRFSSDLAHQFLSDPDAQNRLLSSISALMREKRYHGLNIDFEYVYPNDREGYNQFLRRASSHLKPQGFSLSTALAPKIRADQPGLLYEAHDYPVHGQVCDFVILMTYEWGWAGGPPLAIAPINEVRRVLDYAVTAIPRNKILMGMPTYGRDWKLPYVKGVTLARSLTPNQAVDQAARYGVSISYHPVYQSPYYRYRDENGIEHEVWYEDARSVQAKLETVKQYGLRGISYWELSSPFPQNWPILWENFRIRKLG